MKILKLSTHDLSGGAAIAAYRLHLGLRAQNIDSTMLVADKTGSDPHTIALHNNFTYSLRRNLDRLPLKLDPSPSSIGWRTLAWLPNKKLTTAITHQNPDLLHLHWAQNGFMPLSLLEKNTLPVLWTFHDLWPVCGSLHHEYENDLRYPEPYTATNRPKERKGLDLDRRVAEKKAKIYHNSRIHAVVPSQWMADQVRKSHLWKDRPLSVIPNGLDTELFKPLDRTAARQLLNLPLDKTLILFGAMFAGSDKNKGYPQLREALDRLTLSKTDTHLAVFGMSAPAPGEPPMPFETHWLGILRDPYSLAALYSAADIMIVPSLQESFGQTASEAMACGTPVACFDTSGLRDIVDHQENGHRAEKFNPEDLAHGIEWILSDPTRHHQLTQAARQKVVSKFAIAPVTKAHLEVYQSLLA